MAALLDRLTAGSSVFALETMGGGYVLIANAEHHEAFTQLVRDLLDYNSDDFVVLPVTGGGTGYTRAIILPY